MTNEGVSSADALVRWHIPMLLCQEPASLATDFFPLDRIRMQKAVFLVTMRGPAEWRETYPYMPYNWGPYSPTLTEDLRACESRQLLILSFAQGDRYGRYRLTHDGQKVVEEVSRFLPQEILVFLSSVRSWVVKRDFNTLLREVYDSYPAFATESRWKGSK